MPGAAEPAWGSADKRSAECGGRRRVLLLWCFRGGKVELDDDAIRIFEKHLMQAESGYAALEIIHVAALASLDHALSSRDGKRDMVEGAGAAFERLGIHVAQGVDETLRVV